MILPILLSSSVNRSPRFLGSLFVDVRAPLGHPFLVLDRLKKGRVRRAERQNLARKTTATISIRRRPPGERVSPNENIEGLAQILGQFQASNRDL
jgi:hypothetical protein